MPALAAMAHLDGRQRALDGEADAAAEAGTVVLEAHVVSVRPGARWRCGLVDGCANELPRLQFLRHKKQDGSKHCGPKVFGQLLAKPKRVTSGFQSQSAGSTHAVSSGIDVIRSSALLNIFASRLLNEWVIAQRRHCRPVGR